MSTGATAARQKRASFHHPSSSPTGSLDARIGPNAVTRTLEAAEELAGAERAARLRLDAGIPDRFPEGLIPEAWFVRLTGRVRETLPEDTAEAVLARAGALTARYVTHNRIPGPFRLLLRILPRRMALPLLLHAFRRHAWTFAGSGRFRFEGPHPPTLVLEGAPTCSHGNGPARSGAYYEAAFRDLLSIAAPGIRVREVACQAGGASACRFQLQLAVTDPAGDLPCASS